MPREAIELDLRLERLDVLDAEGRVDEDLEPEVVDERLVAFYRTMLLGRRLDERMLSLQGQGRLGTFAPIRGQEASQVGAAAALEARDWMVPSFREMVAELWRGRRPLDVLLLYAGYDEGGRVPDDRNDLPVCIPVGSQIPQAVGIAHACRLRGDDAVVMVFFGDGATSEGDFHEALNFAGVLDAPIVFVTQNNQWAISVPRSRQTAAGTLAQKAVAYGLPGVQVDGNDVLAVHVAAAEAVARARRGDGPTLVECVTYRLGVHTTADDPSRYRDEEEVEAWEAKEPLSRFAAYLADKGLLGEEGREEMEKEVVADIDEAVERWESASEDLGDPLGMFEHVLAERPSYLERQRRELADLLGKD